tara:strand:- start:16 stop:177 length:162 start_codon:yes stop_codon:yes gene_type:complete
LAALALAIGDKKHTPFFHISYASSEEGKTVEDMGWPIRSLIAAEQKSKQLKKG